ncbi:Hypothetical predicted protein [Xyrichtys novacula]|uniref:Uncharacterized protein n=1 Tax=Xyrichtys novacula TaxID=13765 RepID=A0AAV1HJ65_XYRNO|nr:Hypothetical predicted protein [Xyrichtys novacula]
MKDPLCLVVYGCNAKSSGCPVENVPLGIVSHLRLPFPASPLLPSLLTLVGKPESTVKHHANTHHTHIYTHAKATGNTATFANGYKLVDLVQGSEGRSRGGGGAGGGRRGVEWRGEVCVKEREREGGLVLLESCRSAAREEGYGLDGYVPEKAHAGKI